VDKIIDPKSDLGDQLLVASFGEPRREVWQIRA